MVFKNYQGKVQYIHFLGGERVIINLWNISLSAPELLEPIYEDWQFFFLTLFAELHCKAETEFLFNEADLWHEIYTRLSGLCYPGSASTVLWWRFLITNVHSASVLM